MGIKDKLLNRQKDGIVVSIDRDVWNDAVIRTVRSGHGQDRLMEKELDAVDVDINAAETDIPDGMDEDEAVDEMESRLESLIYQSIVLKE